MTRLAGLLVLLAAVFGACTLLTSFNPEGQPCDQAAPPAEQCLPKYHCQNGKCVMGAYDGGP